MVLEPIKYKRGSLQIINQLVIPAKTEYIDICSFGFTVEDLVKLGIILENVASA